MPPIESPGLGLDAEGRMEAGTVGTPTGTGTRTMAGLAAQAASKYADHPAQKHKVGDEWVDTSYNELGTSASEVGRGLIDLGLDRGDRVSILASTRPDTLSLHDALP